MGLDIVEFALEVEQAFQLKITDQEFVEWTTPRRVIDCVSKYLLVGDGDDCCLSQRTFHRLRQALCARLALPRATMRPDSILRELIAGPTRQTLWEKIGQDLGARQWGRIYEPWRFLPFGSGFTTLADAVNFVVTTTPTSIRRPGECWSRRQIADVVHRLVESNFGIRPGSYHDDMGFREDFGVD